MVRKANKRESTRKLYETMLNNGDNNLHTLLSKRDYSALMRKFQRAGVTVTRHEEDGLVVGLRPEAGELNELELVE